MLANPGEVWRGREVSPCSINFDGMYVKIAFFGSKRLRLRRKMSSCQSGCRPETRESFRQPQTLLLRIDKPQFVNALKAPVREPFSVSQAGFLTPFQLFFIKPAMSFSRSD